MDRSAMKDGVVATIESYVYDITTQSPQSTCQYRALVHRTLRPKEVLIPEGHNASRASHARGEQDKLAGVVYIAIPGPGANSWTRSRPWLEAYVYVKLLATR